jgi:steroid delta-isomerase-like uncharacterized protein
MSAEGNKAVFRRMNELYTDHNVAGLDEVWADDFIDHNIAVPQPLNRPAAQGVLQGFFDSVPDLIFHTDDLVADDSKVVARWTGVGTMTGKPFLGIPATGQKVEFNGMEVCIIRNNKMVERWMLFDTLGFMQQIGAKLEMA